MNDVTLLFKISEHNGAVNASVSGFPAHIRSSAELYDWLESCEPHTTITRFLEVSRVCNLDGRLDYAPGWWLDSVNGRIFLSRDEL